MKTPNVRRIAVLGMMLMLVTSIFAMPAAAAFTEQPTVAASSDISDGATISVVDASSSNVSSLVVHTNNSDTMDAADVTFDLNNTDRNHTVYSADMTSSEYSLTADVDTTGDGSADSNEHTWNISHDEFADVPVDYNSTTDVDFEVEFTDSAGATANVTGTITISNDGDRVVTVVDSSSVDNSAVGPSVESQTQEAGTLASISPFHSGTEHDLYTLDDSLSSDANATHEIYLADGDVADAYASSAEDAEAGDVLVEQTMMTNDDLILTFNEEANTDIVDTSTDAYAVYDSSADKITIEPGEDHNNTSIDVMTANDNPVEFASNDEVASTFSDAFGTLDLIRNFSVGVAMASFGLPTLAFLFAIGAPKLRERYAA